ncbi:MAG: DNA-directed RNA polymerase subunit omega [Actinomycetota bacterium]|nr:DNA-directed RNA polymerase subunit omega [Actinomycetota bacterium]
MADGRNTMMYPPIEILLDRADSKFTLVTLAAKRGREINSYFNRLGDGLGSIVPPQVASVARKPLSIAFEEIAAGKAVYAYAEESSAGSPDGESPAVAGASDQPDSLAESAADAERAGEAEGDSA